MHVPAAKFSRALGHKVGNLIGIEPIIEVNSAVIEERQMQKLKILLLSSQLAYISQNSHFRETFATMKFAEEDLKTQVQAIIKGLEKHNKLYCDDFGLIYFFQN